MYVSQAANQSFQSSELSFLALGERMISSSRISRELSNSIMCTLGQNDTVELERTRTTGALGFLEVCNRCSDDDDGVLSHVRSSSCEYLRRAALQLPLRRHEGRGDGGEDSVAGDAGILGLDVCGDGGGVGVVDIRLEPPHEAW